ncbi:killer cell lectin-like receptor subfamily G member 2 isoform X1 [Elephas maximus indicus]|uniref:killer cell lectin-like receptor subfamily G member 2 isoform X1 n=1 Tax=Elephas maximus indicus TaxID=99487 RepID=UPI002115FC75|nr:killer cell lectin-like receptor subfamily G member 2 isoform X1 [Elephas maximus indicus]
MERVGAASGAERAGPELPMEPLGSREPGPEPEPEPGPAEEARRPDSPPRSPGPAGDERRRPARPRSLGMGYGAFHHPGGPEPPSPVAEPPRDGDTPGPEPGAWAPMDLQVDVRVEPVGAAGGRAPSPVPPTRFLTVPVPESPLPSPSATQSPLAAPWAGELAGPAEGSPESPPGYCRCRELGLDGKEGAALLPHAKGTRLPRAIELMGLPMYMKSLRWALAIMAFLLAVSTVTMVALAARAGAGCRRCPQGWMWVEEQCFYLSADAQAWEASQAFCSAHHATLPLLSHTQGFLSNHHVAPRSWVGALRGPQGWYWTDGTPLPLQLLPEDDDHPELSCGGLEEGRLVALDCTAPRPWICAQAPQ